MVEGEAVNTLFPCYMIKVSSKPVMEMQISVACVISALPNMPVAERPYLIPSDTEAGSKTCFSFSGCRLSLLI